MWEWQSWAKNNSTTTWTYKARTRISQVEGRIAAIFLLFAAFGIYWHLSHRQTDFLVITTVGLLALYVFLPVERIGYRAANTIVVMVGLIATTTFAWVDSALVYLYPVLIAGSVGSHKRCSKFAPVASFVALAGLHIIAGVPLDDVVRAGAISAFAGLLSWLTIVNAHNAHVESISLIEKQVIGSLKETNATLANAGQSDIKFRQFLRSASDEYRNPLSSIVGFSAYWASKDLADKDLKSDMHTIYATAQQLNVKLSNLLDMAKLDAGQLTLFDQECDVQTLLDSVCQITQQLLPADSQVVFEASIFLESGVIWVDQVRLKQVLLNFLLNAVDYTPNGGRIQLLAEETTDVFTMSIVNTGSSIDTSLFGSSDGSTLPRDYSITDEGGLGFGQIVSNQLILLMGGDLTVWDEPDDGTVVQITLPKKVAK